MPQTNPYFPCLLVAHDDNVSIICSQFQYFDDYFQGQDVGGYIVEKLAKSLLKEHAIAGVELDSEAGMFCAYASNKEPLQLLAAQLRKITGDESRHTIKSLQESKISLDEAERLLLNGFVLSLDEHAQQRFLQQIPSPEMSLRQAELIHLVQEGTDAEKVKAAKKLNSEARTLTRQWQHYLSHPATIELLLRCCDANQGNVAVFQELIWALVFICGRHLPDLRTQPYFQACLSHKRQQLRILGIWGLDSIAALDAEMLQPLLSDKSAKVRQEAERYAAGDRSKERTFASWMFDSKNVASCRQQNC